MNRREFVAGSLALSTAASIGPAWAQSGPLTKIIFPFAAGGSGDMLCRQLAEYLPEAFDRKFIETGRQGGYCWGQNRPIALGGGWCDRQGLCALDGLGIVGKV